MNRTVHLTAAFAAAVLLLAWASQVASPAGRAARQVGAHPGDPLFFDLELRDAEGQVVMNPRVVGEAGRPTRIELQSLPPTLWGEGSVPAVAEEGSAPMCIVLDPLGAVDGLDMSIGLSVGDAPMQRARLRMPIGQRRVVAFEDGAGRSFELSLLAYRMDSPEFERYVEAMRRRVAAGRPPEA
ncbi:MAG: hypothetical protein D6729_15980 [Deltaproteobacteria bacterium]|nr:MAG: hypothetical protein D6729_15980 [Deltaproteobacteria bacterium]